MIPQYFAEFQTDRIVREHFFPDPTYRGVMVEVGAATPEFLSMSQHFRLNGWRCICVEPNPKYVELHRKRGNEVYPYACGEADLDGQDFEIAHRDGDYEKNEFTDHSFSALKVKEAYKAKEPSFYQLDVIKTKVDVRRLDTILSGIGVEEVSFLSVDVEGWELEVMRGFSVQKYRPRVILLENFLHAPEYVEFMNRLGYSLAGRVEYNYLFSPASIWNSASGRRRTLADP